MRGEPKRVGLLVSRKRPAVSTEERPCGAPFRPAYTLNRASRKEPSSKLSTPTDVWLCADVDRIIVPLRRTPDPHWVGYVRDDGKARTALVSFRGSRGERS